MTEESFIKFLESDPSLKKLLEIALPIAQHQDKQLKDVIPKVFEEYQSSESYDKVRKNSL